MPTVIVEKIVDPEAELTNAQRIYNQLAPQCSVARRAEGEPRFAMQEKQMSILNNELNETLLCIKLASKGLHAIHDAAVKKDIKGSIVKTESLDATLKSEKAQESEVDLMNYLAKKRLLNLSQIIPTGIEEQTMLENASNRLRRMENRLDMATKRLCVVNYDNSSLREEINRLLVERHSFNVQWDRTIGKLLRGKAYLMDIFEMATKAFGERDEVCRRLDRLKWRGLNGLNKDIAEMQSYQEDLNHLASLEEFLRIKGTTRVCEADEKEDAKRHDDIVKCEHEIASHDDLINDVFNFADTHKVSKIAANFKRDELMNHSLFIHLCEVMQEAIFVRKDLDTLRQNILDARDIHEAKNEQMDRRLNEMMMEINEQQKRNQATLQQKIDGDNVINKILKGIEDLVRISKCDVSPLLTLLGNHEVLTKFNFSEFLRVLVKEIKSIIEVVYDAVKYPPTISHLHIEPVSKIVADPYVERIRPNKLEKLMPYTPCAYCVEDYIMHLIFEQPTVPADEEYIQNIFHLEDVNTRFGIYTLTIPTMATKNRIHHMIKLIDVNQEMVKMDRIEETSIECSEYDLPKPGCSKNYVAKHYSSDIVMLPDNEDNIFTEADQTFLICLDIISVLIDTLPLPDMDYSAESSDDFIPNTDTSDSDSIDARTTHKRMRAITLRQRNVIVPESGSDSGEKESFWDKEGIHQGRKRKPRRSNKERRIDRENRKSMRNLGKSYTTNKGKVIGERKIKPLGPCRMKCVERISEEFRVKIFDFYWGLGDYDKRVQFISNLIELKEKTTTKLANVVKNRMFANNYYLKLNLECHPICKGCFLKTFSETPKFIQNVTDKMKVNGSFIPNSSRGKTPSAFTISHDRLEIVKSHILSFPCYESHYGRSKSNKKFLLPHLTLQDMYKSYRESNDNPVSLTIYSWVFKAQNLSFKTPSLDTCVKCDTFHMKIKFSEGTEREENEKLMKDHQKRAEKVYDKKSTDRALSIERRDTVVLTFDLQQCLPTPYLKSGAAFYKLPPWTYNLTLRDCTSNMVYCFMWHEAIGGSGANQIASCLYYYIMNCMPAEIKHLIFYSDSCSGQNKNIHVICMFLLAMRNNPNNNIHSITHNFFVPGHTHMDCDIDHAVIERAKKKTPMDIHHPRDWYQLVRSCGKKNKFIVIEMHTDLFLDIASLLKGPLQQKKIDENKNKFNLSECAVFKYIKGEFPTFYYKLYDADDWNLVSLQRKRGKSPLHSVFNTECLPHSYDGPIPISDEKKRDLISLLPLINPSARSFYNDLLSNKDIQDEHPLLNDNNDE